MTHVALLGSPFLGPEPWLPVAAALHRRGHEASVVAGRGGSPDEVLAGFLAALDGAGPVLLVPHSNAGLYAAAVAAGHPVEGLVFVDALVPGTGPRTAVAPAAFTDRLRSLADGAGLLPVWTRWWPEEETVDLFGSPTQQDEVESGAPRMPLSYLESVVPTPGGWQALPAAYLGFGNAYADEQARARAAGWPVEVRPGRHLEMMRAPEAVADAVLRLAAAARLD